MTILMEPVANDVLPVDCKHLEHNYSEVIRYLTTLKICNAMFKDCKAPSTRSGTLVGSPYGAVENLTSPFSKRRGTELAVPPLSPGDKELFLRSHSRQSSFRGDDEDWMFPWERPTSAPQRSKEDRGRALVDYTGLLSDSIPDDLEGIARGGRRDLKNNANLHAMVTFWVQENEKIEFIASVLTQLTRPRDIEVVEFQLDIARAPVFRRNGPFATYYEDDNGYLLAKYEDNDPTYVFNLGRCPEPAFPYLGNRYERTWVADEIAEKSRWEKTTSRVRSMDPQDPVGYLDRYDWMESRIFTLDVKLVELRKDILMKEEEMERKTARKIRGEMMKKAVKKGSKLDPRAGMFVPRV